METKICNKCDKEKSINKFSKDKYKKDGLLTICKECISEYKKIYYKRNTKKVKDKSRKWHNDNKEKASIQAKKYRKDNSDKIKKQKQLYNQNNFEKISKSRKEYRIKNSEKIAEINKEYYKKHSKQISIKAKIYKKNNAEKIDEWNKEYCQTHKNERNIYAREKYKNDPIYKLNHSISTGMCKSLNGNKNGRHWETLVNYMLRDLKKYIEVQFKEGMSWKNYGKWQIDHRIPVSIFNITGVKSKGFKKCWALDNLQPMWKNENIRKRNKLFV